MTSVELESLDGERLLHPEDSSDRNIIQKRQPEVEEPLSRYWPRGVVALFVPLAVAVYYGVIWTYFVLGIPNDEAVKCRSFNGSLIFYSWFVIGVFVLSWSDFGLVGVETAMLFRSRFWAAPNLVALLMHSNCTWSSPSGWFKALKRRQFHRLWSLLAFTSFLPFIAIPLSGLVFELSDGYIKTSDSPTVQGRNTTNFNFRYDSALRISNPADHAWLVGSAPAIPGFGVIHTNHSVDRSKHSDFKTTPNTLPLTETIPDLFLAPQADKPVSGKAWGVRIKYECSRVRSVSQFTILSHKHTPSVRDYNCDEDDQCINPKNVPESQIRFKNTTGEAMWGYNVVAYYEVGIRASGFEEGEGNGTAVFEFAAWQYRIVMSPDDRELPFDNKTIEFSIEGMGSPISLQNDTYIVNRTFFKMDVEEFPSNKPPFNPSELVATLATDIGQSPTPQHRRVIDLVPPIGVRCISTSELGTAELDGITSSFYNFNRTDPVFFPAFGFGPKRFGHTAQGMMANGGFYQHYISGGLPGLQPNENSNRFSQFVDDRSLLRSANLAYAWDAFDLMYGVTSGFRNEWLAENLTSSHEGKILVVASLIPGPAMGYFVLVLLSVWAAGLAAAYGFRKRPSDRVDGYVMLRRGAEMAEELRRNEDFMAGRPFQESRTMTGLRGS